jgi:hypothetical protein
MVVFLKRLKMKVKVCSECGKEGLLWRSKPALCQSYKPIREEFLKAHPDCQLKLQGCTFVSTEIEHRQGKSSKELYLDSTKWFAVCRNCHTLVEGLGEQAYTKGLKLKRNINLILE